MDHFLVETTIDTSLNLFLCINMFFHPMPSIPTFYGLAGYRLHGGIFLMLRPNLKICYFQFYVWKIWAENKHGQGSQSKILKLCNLTKFLILFKCLPWIMLLIVFATVWNHFFWEIFNLLIFTSNMGCIHGLIFPKQNPYSNFNFWT